MAWPVSIVPLIYREELAFFVAGMAGSGEIGETFKSANALPIRLNARIEIEIESIQFTAQIKPTHHVPLNRRTVLNRIEDTLFAHALSLYYSGNIMIRPFRIQLLSVKDLFYYVFIYLLYS